MDSHQWFQQLRNALHDQGVPFMYANRLMDELWHHYLETKEQEEMNGFVETKKSITERLGSPESSRLKPLRYRNQAGSVAMLG